MELTYKSSQSVVDLFRAEHSRIPKEKVQENTTDLLDYLEKIDLTEQGITNNIHEYQEKIIELLKGGAKITVLTHNNALSYFTTYHFRILEDILSSRHELGNVFDRFLKMLLTMSYSNDEDCLICAQSSNFHEFLSAILLSKTRETHILRKTIKVIYGFVYEKPQTSDLFNYDLIIKNLYNNYNEYFFMNRTKDFVGDEDTNTIIQKVIIKSFELILIFLVYNPRKTKALDDYVFRLVVTFENILENRRSNEDPEIYFLQVKMILFQLHYILTHTDESIIDRFSTFLIIQGIINCISLGDEIAIYALECLKEYALHFSGAYLIIRKSREEFKQNFNTYRPSESEFTEPEKYIRAIKAFCQVWTNAIKSILTVKNSTKGRVQSAKINIQNNAESILEYIKSISEIQDDFEYQQIISRTFISFAYYNDDNTLSHVVTQAPDIIDKLNRVLEERNPEDIFMITTGLINVIDFFAKGGFKIEQIGKDLANYKYDILNGLNEMRENYESPDENEIRELDYSVNRINEMFAQLFPGEE